ncbi:MAG: hypothetical protein HY735_18945 [Verrucomicrobia bacterium]|nr:hypothetical protein [Verrucomicrobiota bacterium]
MKTWSEERDRARLQHEEALKVRDKRIRELEQRLKVLEERNAAKPNAETANNRLASQSSQRIDKQRIQQLAAEMRSAVENNTEKGAPTVITSSYLGPSRILGDATFKNARDTVDDHLGRRVDWEGVAEMIKGLESFRTGLAGKSRHRYEGVVNTNLELMAGHLNRVREVVTEEQQGMFDEALEDDRILSKFTQAAELSSALQMRLEMTKAELLDRQAAIASQLATRSSGEASRANSENSGR